MPRVNSNGIELEYELFEPAPNDAVNLETIVLIMGLGCQLIHWPDEFVDLLVAQGFRVVRFDNRDIGLSSKMEGLSAIPRGRFDIPRWLMGARLKSHYTLRDMAADTTGLMDALNIDKAHIVGVSMGGMIGQRLAIDSPQRVQSLTSIMSSSGARRVGYPRRDVMKVLTRRPTDTDRNTLIEFGIENWTVLQGSDYKTSAEELRPFVERLVDRSIYPAGFVRQLQAIMNAPNRVSELKKLTVPTLVIHGSDDPLIHDSGAKSVAGAVPNARLELIAGWGHDLPAALNNKITGMIAEHARSA